MLANATSGDRWSEQNRGALEKKDQGKDEARYEKEGTIEHTYVYHATILQTVSSTRKGGTFWQLGRYPATEPMCWDSNANFDFGQMEKKLRLSDLLDGTCFQRLKLAGANGRRGNRKHERNFRIRPRNNRILEASKRVYCEREKEIQDQGHPNQFAQHR